MFNCRHRISYSYTSFYHNIGADFNGRFPAGHCYIKTTYYCQKFEAALKIFFAESEFFQLLIQMISSVKCIFFTGIPLLSLCILDPVRELAHYFRWLNARETYPQCTEAASLVSFALSHPFVICHKLNMTLYCASITTVHAFPFRVASMPAVRYDLSGGLPTCLWLFIYQDYSVICISKKLM